MKKILVTGANGFLGSNLTRELYRLGYDVRILVRRGADLTGVTDIPCEVFFGNIDNKADVMLAVTGCQAVVHTAAITDQWAISFEAYERINYIGTQYIVEACLEQRTEKLIYVSTANTMAPGSKAQPGNELNGFTLFHANSGYINTKYLAQQYVLEQVERKQLPAVIVNPTFMIGPNDIKPSSGKLLLYGLHKKVLFYPPGGKNFVYINDVCQGIVNALDNGKVGDCYLLAGDNLSYKEFFQLLGKVAKESRLMIRIPVWVLKLAGLLGSLKERMGGRSGKLNYTAAYLICLDNYYTGKKSVRELKVTYTPMEDAVRKALTWFKEHNYC
ncbi:NAD-dependent epimerase/dehydratase family protein [Chitinophaga nivalis]|uniref:NAD-dependent epimerase/dehydratase family protein n=1 Tax=Chitinophaga nivalis TaxID=2991709 RepID=A0ABT3IGM8_9BACT|nr:NAD-dependent epimerase/dehydratase family protein [Chitinophaga nivalis]MCW3467186.1 NAD-dependent epimerase/dehydratase family protein [Chitinophaga nivalis]MCW3483122.1 NAD-dependent epimerase/dehydratase family protein [Chitinophaga nivalis]